MLGPAPGAGAQRERALRAKALVARGPAARHGARAPLVGELPATGLVVARGAVAHTTKTTNQEPDRTMNSAAEVSEQVKRELRAVHVRSAPVLASHI